MPEKIQILIDGNAVGYTCHHGDPVMTGTGMQVQAVIGFLSSIRELKSRWPEANLIVLWDGKSWRSDVLSTYKERREADLESFDTSKPMDAKTQKQYDAAVKKASTRAAYKKQGPFITEGLRHLAIPQVTCPNYEADDLAAVLADRYVSQGHPVRLVTSDGDWLQLVQERVTWKSHRAPFTFVAPKNFQEKTGFREPYLFVEGKILGGDKGDDVPGIGGFGDVTVENFFKLFDGGLMEFFSWSEKRIEMDWRSMTGKKPPKAVMELYEKGPSNPDLARNRTLVDLRTPNRPAPLPMKIEKGAYDPRALGELARKLDLYKLSSDLGRFLGAFEKDAA